ncbi:MAG TPA: response regulator transcription factor [Candidatus Acidoferrum sp.]|nr:response regulator transcription factor [Candidatus Acidoferrum sp.]
MTDHPKIRAAQIPTLLVERDLLGVEMLSGALKRCQNYFEVVGHSLSSADTVRKLQQFKPALALVSVDLKDGATAGYQVLAHIREHEGQTSAVALLNDSRREHVLEAFRSGARGVVSRDQPFRLLAKCLRKVHEGEIWASNDQIGFVFEALNKESKMLPKNPEGMAQLTPREKDVVGRVVKGMRNAEIGEDLGVSEHTIRNYIMKIYDKLGVSNRVQLTRQCADLFEVETAL